MSKNDKGDNQANVLDKPVVLSEEDLQALASGDAEFEVINVEESDAADLFETPDADIGEMVDDIETENLREQLLEQKELQKVRKRLKTHKGLYGKLYHVSKTGGSISYGKIDDIGKSIDDLETFIQDLILENKEWPGGKWRIQIFNTKHQIQIQHTFTFPQKPEAPIGAQDDNEITKAALAQNAELVKDAMEASKGNGGDKEVLLEIVKASFQRDPDADLKRMTDLIKVVHPPKEANNTMALVLTAIAPIALELVKGMMKSQKQITFAEQMKELKEAGVLGPTSPKGSFDDAVDQFEKISGIIKNISPSSDDGGIVGQLVREVGPHIGNTFSNVSEAFKELAASKRHAIALRAEQMNSGVRRQLSSPASSEQPAMASQENMNKEESAEMHPTIKGIHDAVINDDKEFFPELENVIKTFVGAEVLAQLIAGSVTPDNFVVQIAPQLSSMAPVFNDEEFQAKMIEYVEKFVLYKLDELDNQLGADVLEGICPICAISYDFPTQADYESDKICGDNGCKGVIELAVKDKPPVSEDTAGEVVEVDSDKDELPSSDENSEATLTNEAVTAGKGDSVS